MPTTQDKKSTKYKNDERQGFDEPEGSAISNLINVAATEMADKKAKTAKMEASGGGLFSGGEASEMPGEGPTMRALAGKDPLSVAAKAGLAEATKGDPTAEHNVPTMTSKLDEYNTARDARFKHLKEGELNQSAEMWEGLGKIIQVAGMALGVPALFLAGSGARQHGNKKSDQVWDAFNKESDNLSKDLFGGGDNGDSFRKKWEADRGKEMLEREAFQVERQKALLRDSSPLMTLVKKGIKDGVSASTMASRALVKGDINIGELLLAADVEGIINDMVKSLKADTAEKDEADRLFREKIQAGKSGGKTSTSLGRQYQ